MRCCILYTKFCIYMYLAALAEVMNSSYHAGRWTDIIYNTSHKITCIKGNYKLNMPVLLLISIFSDYEILLLKMMSLDESLLFDFLIKQLISLLILSVVDGLLLQMLPFFICWRRALFFDSYVW